MQFIPTTWSIVGVDADGDGIRNPQDIDDAALAAAVYLCSGDDDLSTDTGIRTAVHRYNHSQKYVDLVLAITHAYQQGDFTTAPNATVSARPFVPESELLTPTAHAATGVAFGSAKARKKRPQAKGEGIQLQQVAGQAPSDSSAPPASAPQPAPEPPSTPPGPATPDPQSPDPQNPDSQNPDSQGPDPQTPDPGPTPPEGPESPETPQPPPGTPPESTPTPGGEDCAAEPGTGPDGTDHDDAEETAPGCEPAAGDEPTPPRDGVDEAARRR